MKIWTGKGSKKGFWLPLKKTGEPGALFYCLPAVSDSSCDVGFLGRPQPSGRKAVYMLTLQELKQFVGVPGDRGKLPTARQLRESGSVVARERLGVDAEVSVYQDGCVLYQVGSRATVFPLHSCGDYFYISDGGTVHLPG